MGRDKKYLMVLVLKSNRAFRGLKDTGQDSRRWSLSISHLSNLGEPILSVFSGSRSWLTGEDLDVVSWSGVAPGDAFLPNVVVKSS